MKTADRENPNSLTWLCNKPSKWVGRPETYSLIHRGWKARKFPAMGEVFFLTLPFIEFPFASLETTALSIPVALKRYQIYICLGSQNG
jgi:hypothetical protein